MSINQTRRPGQRRGRGAGQKSEADRQRAAALAAEAALEAPPAAAAPPPERNDSLSRGRVPLSGRDASGAASRDASGAPSRLTDTKESSALSERKPPARRRRRPRSPKPAESVAPVAQETADPAEPPRIERARRGTGSADQAEQAPAEGVAPKESGRRPRRRTATTDEQVSTLQAPQTTEKDAEDAPASRNGTSPRRRERRPRRSGTVRRRIHSDDGPERTMVVRSAGGVIEIAMLEERDLVEHFVSKPEEGSIVGNIYIGEVKNVLPGMEAAFIDIGVARNAVLYAGEVSYDEAELEGDRRIEAVLKPGQAIVVQVTKDPLGSKGARLTTKVSVAGRYLVLVPGEGGIGISRRLEDSERDRLRSLTEGLRPKKFGLIVRTAALGAEGEDLRRDIERLVRIWEDISKKMKKQKVPSLLQADSALAIRVVRDRLDSEMVQVVIDDPGIFDEVTQYVNELSPALASRVERYEGALPIFEEYHVVEQLQKALDRKVWLRSGGHIVIDKTEALTVVDVNTGGFVGKSSLEDTVYKTNIEAADEVAKQLRLRDIGGIIVIDFIDMGIESNRMGVIRALRNALSKDKTTTAVYGISELGIVQMTRKNVSDGLIEAYMTGCDTCGGRGLVQSRELE